MKKILIGLSSLILVGAILSGCEEPTEVEKTLAQQEKSKLEQSTKLMKQVNVPSFDNSVERENIADRLIATNDPTMIQWIYPMSAGRVIGRFPVRGKVTSGSKRLTPTQMEVKVEGDGSTQQGVLGEAPDEMGAYGSSDAYVFWFDPAGQYHQHRGDYFLSPVPYKIDLGNGTIDVEVDEKENDNLSEYESQAKESVKEDK